MQATVQVMTVQQEPRSCQGESLEEAQIYSEPQWMSQGSGSSDEGRIV